MGDRNQELFLRNFAGNTAGPILEIGSKDYGNTVNFRNLFPENPYVGVDLEPGPGVDAVLDFSQGIGSFKDNYFSLCICCSVMEHCSRPWVMAENMTRVLAPGGRLFVSVPWVWGYHPYPEDYFRFSFPGIKALFPQIAWEQCYYTTKKIGVFHRHDADSPDNRMAIMVKPEDPAERAEKYLPSMMVNALGVKAAIPRSMSNRE